MTCNAITIGLGSGNRKSGRNNGNTSGKGNKEKNGERKAGKGGNATEAPRITETGESSALDAAGDDGLQSYSPENDL